MYVYVRTYVYVVCVSLCYTHMYLLTCIRNITGKEVCSECDDPGWCRTASDCSECDAGSSSGAGSSNCTLCDKGTFASESVVSFPPGNDDVTSGGDY